MIWYFVSLLSLEWFLIVSQIIPHLDAYPNADILWCQVRSCATFSHSHHPHVGTYRRNPSTTAPGPTLGHASSPRPTLPSITRANILIMLAVNLQVLLPQEARYVTLWISCSRCLNPEPFFFFCRRSTRKKSRHSYTPPSLSNIIILCFSSTPSRNNAALLNFGP